MKTRTSYISHDQFYGCWRRRVLQCRHTECDGLSNHQPLDYLLGRLFSDARQTHVKENIKAPPETGGVPSQRASNAEYVTFDDVIMELEFPKQSIIEAPNGSILNYAPDKIVIQAPPFCVLSPLYTGLWPSCHLCATIKMVRTLSGRRNPESSVSV